MPLYIKIDVADNGGIYAWMKNDKEGPYPPSNLHSISVPALLRKLAKKIATEAK